MQKILYFLHKTDEEEVLNFFNEILVETLSKMSGKEIHIGQVENSFLLNQKFVSFCEIEMQSQTQMNELMVSNEGKSLNKMLMNYHTHITIIIVNFRGTE